MDLTKGLVATELVLQVGTTIYFQKQISALQAKIAELETQLAHVVAHVHHSQQELQAKFLRTTSRESLRERPTEPDLAATRALLRESLTEEEEPEEENEVERALRLKSEEAK